VSWRGCKGMPESEFGRREGLMEYAEKGRHASWRNEIFLMRLHAFVVLMRCLDEITWFCCRIFSRDLRKGFRPFLRL
jgi:hypothetical protein